MLRKSSHIRLASIGLAAVTFGAPFVAHAQGRSYASQNDPSKGVPGAAFKSTKKMSTDTAVDRSDKNIVLTADTVSRDDINNTVSAAGHVELVQGPTMVLAERMTWNRNTDIVTATGNVKLVSDNGDIYFGDYLEITDDMRQGFVDNVSGLLSDNSRVAGRKANKDGDIVTIYRGVYSPCELCVDDPTRPPTWQIKAVKVIHDSKDKRLYYHDATFEIDGFPIAWTPYFSTYDPTVKRASGFLETLPGYRSQLGEFLRSRYYLDLAPDMDLVLEGGYYTRQGPLIGGDFRERFSTGQIELSGSLAESDIRQYPTSINVDEKTVRGHIFGQGEFDLDNNWRTGFDFARSLDNIYVLKYGISSLQVLPSKLYVEGFFDRDYINASLDSFQDLRAGIKQPQPKALPYGTYSFLGDPGETFGGRWADTGSLLLIRRFPGQDVERLANNASWSRKLVTDFGLVTNVDASLETDYYWTQDPQADSVTQKISAERSVGRVFPQADVMMSYPFERPIGYAQMIIEPIVSAVAAPARTNNLSIPNEDSQDIQLDAANLFSGDRFPGTDRIEDGSRVTYGVRAGIYNLGTGYASLFLGQSYRISGTTLYLPPTSGLLTGLSDYVGQVDIVPGKLVDISYRTEWSNDLKVDRLQEVIFKVGPDNFGIFGSYLYAGAVTVPSFATGERNELSLSGYYKFTDHWSVSASSTTELTKPTKILRYSLNATYTDDCSTVTVSGWHDQTFLVGGASGTGFVVQFSLKNLGIFRTPSIH